MANAAKPNNVICPAASECAESYVYNYDQKPPFFLSYYYNQSCSQRSGPPCLFVYSALETNLHRALYLRHPLLEQKQVEVSKHFARGQRPLQCVVVPLNHRQATFTALLLVQQILR